MRLSDLVEEVQLPGTRVAEDAWEQARVRLRIRRIAVATGALAVAAAAVVIANLPTLVGQGDDSEPPVVTPPPTAQTPSNSLPVRPNPITPELTMPQLRATDYRDMAERAPVVEVSDAVPLSADPVRRAVLALVPRGDSLSADDRWTTIYVLGDDGGWRRVDVPDLAPTRDEGGYQWFAMVETSLSPDGTRLALPQPNRLIVVDLTTGTHRIYPAPGLNKAVIWRDTSHVILTTEREEMGWKTESTGREVDLDTGRVSPSAYGATTRFLPNGSAVSWPKRGEDPTDLVVDDGNHVATSVANDAGAQATSPLVNEQVVVGKTALTGGPPGIAVVDRHTGDALAFQPTMVSNAEFTYLLGFDGDAILMGLVNWDSTNRIMVRWDWQQRTLEPIAIVNAAMFSWSGPLSELLP
jgi:hypothetical protein